MKKVILKILKIMTVGALLLIVLVLGLNFWIVSATSDQIYYRVDQIPPRRIALLLGTSKHVVGGGSNKYFEERIQAAVDLYRRGTIKHIIVSGDNETIYYNEPKDMYKALVAQGVDRADITLDFAGFRTLDSVVRAKMVFGQDELVIITQDFHCYRALFIAQFYAINAVAFSADNKDELPFELALREVLARANTILDLYVFQTGPKFLGEKENVEAK